MFKLISILLITSCTTLSGIRKSKEYFHDMNLDVNGTKGKGFVVVDSATDYIIHASWKYKVSELVSLLNCHREIPIKPYSGLFKRGQRKMTFKFRPTGIERDANCPSRISAYDNKGRHSFGAIYFRAYDETIPITLHCNGKEDSHFGMSVCQSRAGSSVMIEFEKHMNWAGEEECPPMVEVKPGVFEYISLVGECVYTFGTSGSKQFHRHVSFGYNNHLLRSE